MVKEIRGLKCPSHDYVRDNHHFVYEHPIGLSPALVVCVVNNHVTT